MRQNRSMGLAWPRSREKKRKEKKKSRNQEKKKKSHTRSIFCQNSTSHGGATGYSIGTKFGRLVGPFDLITHANFKLDRLRTGCVELHESLPSFRFSALHRLSPLTQLGPAGPLVIHTYIHKMHMSLYFTLPGGAPYCSIVTKIGRDVDIGCVINRAKFEMDR